MAHSHKHFVVSVEPRGDKTWQLDRVFLNAVDARTEAEMQFRSVDAVTVAVMHGGKICDVFDGEWSSEYDRDWNDA